MQVRGVTELVNVYEVTGLGRLRTHFELSARRGLTTFVGREREIAEMRRTLQLATGGRGQIVAVVADAGTGKSRLFYEFKATLPADCKLLEAYSVSYGKASAWLPVLDLLRDYFAIQDADDAATRREKVRAALGVLDSAMQDTLPYLFGLLGLVEGPDPLAQMDPQVKRRRTLDAIKRIILRESLNQPLVVIFEDLHWIDEQTQALLDQLADSISSARVLLLVNYRPEYRHEWGQNSRYLQLELNPLGRESAEELLAALLQDAVELQPLKGLIIERTGGNPFFIEEMVQALFDERILVRNGSVKVTRTLSQIRIPPTVQGILAARIDRLSSEQKELLQTLAVIGRESPFGLIRKMTSATNSELERMLAELRAAEFIYEQPALAESEHVFKHALTQEVAYNSLLIERRKQLHERAGQALESMFGEQLDDQLTQLAHHYSHSENIDKAIEYLGRAGQQAVQRSALAEAVSSLTAAIDLLRNRQDGPDRVRQELPLLLMLGPAFMSIQGWASPEVERTYARAKLLCDQLGDSREAFPALAGLFYLYLLRAELPRAREFAERMLRHAESANDPELLMMAHLALGQVSFSLAELALAREHLESAVSIYHREHAQEFARFGGVEIGVPALSFLGRTLWLLGYPEQGFKRADEALVLAQKISHPPSLAFAVNFVGVLHQYQRQAAAFKETTERLIELSREHGLSFWLAVAITRHGWATAMQQDHERAVREIEEGMAAFHATGTQLDQPYWACLRAEVYSEAGRVGDALNALAAALIAANDHEDRHYEAEVHRNKGELLLRQDDSNIRKGEECFRRAIEIARVQSSKSFELRATASLARLLAKDNRGDEALTMLAEIYNWFTEGFDTADLKEAKALLDQLTVNR